MADVKTPIGILFEDASLSELSEDFKAKASVIFESAVAAGVAEIKKTLDEEYTQKLEEQKESVAKDMEAKIDSYLTYVAEEWLKENELAVDNGIQIEIAENFLKGLKDLFTESYVEIPESKVDVVAEMTTELEKKAAALDEAIDKTIALKKEIKDMKRQKIVSEATVGLADTQIAKVNDLVEMVDFVDESQFSGRVKSIVETYIKKVDESDDKDEDDKGGDKDKDEKDEVKDKKEKKETDESMERYVKAISESIR